MYRGYVLHKLYRQLLLLSLAATVVQRIWRGFSTRKRTSRLHDLDRIAPEKRAAYLLIEAERKVCLISDACGLPIGFPLVLCTCVFRLLLSNCPISLCNRLFAA